MIHTLENYLNDRGVDFIEKLFNQPLVVYEKISASYIFVEVIKENNEKNFLFYKNRQQPITFTDRIISKYYEKIINYFEDNKNDFLKKLEVGQLFCFYYIPFKNSSLITYKNIPKNNLILLNVKNKKSPDLDYSENTLKKYSDIFNIDSNSFIFNGFLTNDQKEKIFLYLKNKNSVLNTEKFSSFLIKTLNPELTSSMLRDDLESMIESLIFIFGSEKKIYAKLIDPSFESYISLKKKEENNRDDILKIIFSDMVSFLDSSKHLWNKIIFKEFDNFDKKYVLFIDYIFKVFWKENFQRYENLDIKIPDIFKENDFGINLDFIEDKTIKKYLEDYESSEIIYKYFLMLFRKRKKNKNEFHSEYIMELQNKLVSEIGDFLNFNSSNEFPTFEEFLESFNTQDGVLNESEMYEDEHENNIIKIISNGQNFLDKTDLKYKTNNTFKPVNIFIFNFDFLTNEVYNFIKNISEKENLFFILVNKDKSSDLLFSEFHKNIDNPNIIGYEKFDEVFILEEVLDYLNKNKYIVNKIFSEENELLLIELKTLEKIYNIDKIKIELFNFSNKNYKISLRNKDIINFKKIVPKFIEFLFYDLIKIEEIKK